MKKILLVCVFSVFAFGATSYYDPNDKSFRDGFEAGLKALSLQKKQDGYKSKIITNNHPFLVVYETKNIPLNEALFLQAIASREGLESHLSKNFVSFGGFEREIDAKDTLDLLVKKFRLNPKNAKIYRNFKEIKTYPYLWQDFYSVLLEEAMQKGVIVETKTIEKIRYIEPKEPKKEEKKQETTFKLKNTKAMAYKNIDSTKISKDYLEAGLMDSKTYIFEKEVITKENESFVKVKGENLYFSIDDVRISK